MAAGCGSWCHRVAEGLLYPCRLFLEPLRPALGFFTGSPEPFPVPFPQRPPLVTVSLCRRALLGVRSPVLQMLTCESLGRGDLLDAEPTGQARHLLQRFPHCHHSTVVAHPLTWFLPTDCIWETRWTLRTC